MTIFRNKKQSPNGFANEFASRLRETYPEAKVKPGDGYFLCVTHPEGGTVNVHLHNHYAMAMKATGEEREHVLRFAVHSAQPVKSPETWADVAAKILPVVRSTNWVSAQTNLVLRPLAQRVVVALAINSDFSISYLSENNCRIWGVNEAEVWEAAYANLARASFFTHFDEANGVMMVEGADGFSSSLMLLPPRTFAGSWGDDAVVVPVSRDEIFLFGTSDRHRLNVNLGSAIQMYAHDPRQLSPVPYIWSPTGPIEWKPEADDPSFDVVALAQRILQGSEFLPV
jgi:hypothetical protein